MVRGRAHAECARGGLSSRLIPSVAICVVAMIGPACAHGATGASASSEPILPAGGHPGQLYAVSCVSRRFCAAVGSLAEGWNGRAWSIQSGPAVGSAVSCTSLTFCVAVGLGGDSEPSGERWNGRRWSRQRLPQREDIGFGQAGLSGVSCVSTSNCVAVGTDNSCGSDSCTNYAMVYRWNGRAWSDRARDQIHAPPSWEDAGFSSVSCAGSASCTAVGYFDRGFDCTLETTTPCFPLIEHWDGQRWSIQRIHNQGGGSGAGLIGVSCATSTACTAIGSFGDNVRAEHWTGSRWSIQRIATPPGASGVALDGVSCTSRDGCITVGSFTDAVGAQKLLAERMTTSGASIQAVAMPPGATSGALSGVSCTSRTACEAIGRLTIGGQELTLADRLHRSGWSRQQT